MKKRTKILSILLALMLTATLVPTALVQVFASDYEWEDSATADEPYDEPINELDILSIEITKALDHIFSAPCITETANTAEEWNKIRETAEKPENTANSIAYNMNGAELTFYRANGEKEVYTINNNSMIYRFYSGISVEAGGYGFGYMAVYRIYPLGFNDTSGVGISSGDCLTITVADLGNYKALISFENPADEMKLDKYYEFSVNNSSSSEISTTPATPGEVINPTTPSNPSSTVPTSSGNGTSSTSETPANSNTSSNNTGNGAVATGNVAVSAILLSVLLLAAGVMAVIGRKKQLF